MPPDRPDIRAVSLSSGRGPQLSCGPHPPLSTGLRLQLFDARGRKQVKAFLAAAHPGVHFARERAWTAPPRRREGRGGLWLWRDGEEELRAQATSVLLGFVHPLVASGAHYCVAWPFAEDVFAPRALAPGDGAALDLEDIGALLSGQSPFSAGSLLVSAGSSATPTRPLTASGATAVRAPAEGGQRLDAAQRAAVEHAAGPARVLAPAGSGKTKTLVSRVIELVARGSDPGGILLLAFNRKAAEQLEERLAAAGIATTRRLCERRGGRPPAVHCATFNAFGSRYQREVAGARVRLTDGRGQRQLMRGAMEAAGAGLAGLRPVRGSDPVGAFLAGLARVRAGLEDPADVSVRIESLGERPVLDVPFAPVHRHYARLQAVAGEQSFDDQIYLAVLDMLADPRHRALIEARFDHVLVDEFQDLNGAQLALVDVLSRPTRDMFVVGDDDQLIYGWRFADPRGILGFHERMPPAPWSATYTLGTNYRCSRAVVESAARLVANNAVRETKEVRPRDGAPAGAVRFFGAPAWPQRGAAVCAFLRAERARLGCSWRDLAVLCRYRSQQLCVALALDEGGVPRTPALGYRLFTHPVARLLRVYIDLALCPAAASADQVRLLINRPNRYVRDVVRDDIAMAREPWKRLLALAAAEPAAGPRPLTQLALAVERLGAALTGRAGFTGQASLTSGDLVWSTVDAFGLEDWWRDTSAPDDGGGDGAGQGDDAGGHRGDGGEDPLRILDGLLVVAETLPDPGAFLGAWSRLLADEEAGAGMAGDTLEREEGAEDRVVVGTIHAAKGREYDAVVIPDYDCDVTRWEIGAIEEERRVVYVGVTRGRDSVLLTVDTSLPYRHPFLRELVKVPRAGEYESLKARLDEADGGLEAASAPGARLGERLAEIELLYPEAVPEPTDAAAAITTDAPPAIQTRTGREGARAPG